MGGVTMVLFWAVIIAVVVWGIFRVAGGDRSAPSETPLDTLKKRYARGEIDRNEFEQKKRDLEG